MHIPGWNITGLHNEAAMDLTPGTRSRPQDVWNDECVFEAETSGIRINEVYMSHYPITGIGFLHGGHSSTESQPSNMTAPIFQPCQHTEHSSSDPSAIYPAPSDYDLDYNIKTLSNGSTQYGVYNDAHAIQPESDHVSNYMIAYRVNTVSAPAVTQ